MKNFNETDFERSGISLLSIIEFLKACDWKEKQTQWNDIVVYQKPYELHPKAEIVIPAKESDFSYNIFENVIHRLARFSQREEDDVLRTILNPRVDRIKYRLISPAFQNGTTPLNVIQTFIAGVVNSLRSAVKDTVQPEDHHLKLSSSEIDEMMNRAEFGQTEHGSFVVNIFMPIGQTDDNELLEEARPNIYRNSLVHLMKSLDTATKYAEKGNVDDFIRVNRENNLNISSNLLEAIDSARVSEDNDIEISVDWSPIVSVQDVPRQIFVSKKYSSYFKKWNRILNPKNDDTSTKLYIASIASLSGDKRDDQDRPFGTVQLTIFSSDEEQNYLAKVSLDPEQYNTAIEAHKNNYYVSFKGVKKWNKSRVEIINISDFHSITQDK